MKEPNCGGCQGLGLHSRRCRTQPGWLWYRLQDMAEELGDLIGSNDPVSANHAYAISARMDRKAASAGWEGRYADARQNWGGPDDDPVMDLTDARQFTDSTDPADHRDTCAYRGQLRRICDCDLLRREYECRGRMNGGA